MNLHKRLIAILLCIIAIVGVITAIGYSTAPKETRTINASPSAFDETAVDMDKGIGTPNIIVPDDYSTITAAVNNAQEGSVIYVKNGVYLESVTINKSLTLVGENKENTVIDGNNNGPSLLVESSNVKIANFKIRNVEYPPPNSDSLARLAGIHLLEVNNCSIFDNVIVGCGKGVWVYGGNGNSVFDNDFLGNNYGVFLDAAKHNSIISNNAQDGWNGIFLSNSEGNVLKNNSMNSNTCNFGILGESTAAYNNQIDTSNLVDGKILYFLKDSSSQTVSPQTHPDLGALIIANCKDITVQNLYLTNSCSGIQLFNSENIRIVSNTLEGNKYGVYAGNCSDCSLSSNTLKESSATGIHLKDSIEIFVDENSFEQTGSVTVNIEGSSGCTIEENIFVGSHEYGFCLDSSNNNRFANNKQSGADKVMYVFWLKASAGNRIESNSFSLCALGLKISEGSHNNIVIDNSFATDRGSLGLTLNAANGNTISNNIFNNFSTGMELANAENNLISRNTMTCRGSYALELFQFSNNIFEGNQFLGAKEVWDMGPGVGKAASVNTWK